MLDTDIAWKATRLPRWCCYLILNAKISSFKPGDFDRNDVEASHMAESTMADVANHCLAMMRHYQESDTLQAAAISDTERILCSVQYDNIRIYHCLLGAIKSEFISAYHDARVMQDSMEYSSLINHIDHLLAILSMDLKEVKESVGVSS
jgi:hypothetical protein